MPQNLPAKWRQEVGMKAFIAVNFKGMGREPRLVAENASFSPSQALFSELLYRR